MGKDQTLPLISNKYVLKYSKLTSVTADAGNVRAKLVK